MHIYTHESTMLINIYDMYNVCMQGYVQFMLASLTQLVTT
jgi:hypothetical protein